MTNCPCCSNQMLHHVQGKQTYWFCRHCWQEMPILNSIKRTEGFEIEDYSFKQSANILASSRLTQLSYTISARLKQEHIRVAQSSYLEKSY